jgi:ABC-type taurine transport system substrate-binding protein
MDEINFTGKRPSLAQCTKAAKQSAAKGNKAIRLLWGENWLEISQQTNGRWTGYGWLKTIDADKVAQALNQGDALNQAFDDPIKFMREHFTIVHVR